MGCRDVVCRAALVLCSLLPLTAAAQGYDPNRDGQFGYVFLPGSANYDNRVTGLFSGILEFDPKECPPGITAAAFFSTAVDQFAKHVMPKHGKVTVSANRLSHVSTMSNSSGLMDQLRAHKASLSPGKGAEMMWGMNCKSSAIADLVRSGGGRDPRSTLNLNAARLGGSGSGSASSSQATAEQTAALRAAERKEALIAAERKRYGTGRDKEIRQLVELRERIASRKSRMCRSNATKTEINFNYLPGVMLMTRERAEKIYADMRKNSGKSCAQSKPATFGPLMCDSGKGFATCTTTMECPSVEFPCASNAQ